MKDLSMVEGLPKPAFKGWDLTRGCRPRERGKERKARQGGQRQDGTPGRRGPDRARRTGRKGNPSSRSPARSASPLPARPRGAAAPLAPRSRSPTSLPSLRPGTRPCGLPGPAALSPPPPFVSKAREQALKEGGGKVFVFVSFV